MTREEVKKVLASIKFLNFQFMLVEHFSGDVLRIKVDAPDTRDRTQRLKVLHDRTIHVEAILDANHLISEVFDILSMCLRHEAAELFFVGNLLPFDEHHTQEEKNHQQELIKAMFTNESQKPKQNTHTPESDSAGVYRFEPYRQQLRQEE